MKQLVVTKLSPNKMITSNGYLVCTNAVLARTGKQQYLKSELYEDSDDDEIIEVDRKPEQVFAEATIHSFENVPLTCEHPYENVTPENYKEYSVGYVRDVHKGKYNGQDVLLGTLVVCDPQCIQDIQNGYRTELSCGYDCDIVGEDKLQQINIRGNHVALCEQGRAGIAKIVDSAVDLDNNFEVSYSDGNKTHSKLFASLKSAMEYSRRVCDSEITVDSMSIYRNENSERNLYKNIVVKDADLAVGSVYIDEDNQEWQIEKFDGNKYYVNIGNSTQNQIDKTVFEKMIGKMLKPAKELKDSFEVKGINYLGRTITKSLDGTYQAEGKNYYFIGDSVSEVKQAIKDDLKQEAFETVKKIRDEILDGIETTLNDNQIYPEFIDVSEAEIAKDLFVELRLRIEGDWKHDHLYAENLIEEWCNKHNYLITGSKSEQVGDSDDDSYIADYVYYICLDKEKGQALKELLADKSVNDALVAPSEECLLALKEMIESKGWKIEAEGKTISGKKHYQIKTIENTFAAFSVRPKCDELVEVLDTIEDIYGAPCTFSANLMEDGTITAGVDVGKMHVADSKMDYRKGHSENFYKKLANVLEKNIEDIEGEEVTLDSESADDYICQRNKYKRELRKQLKEIEGK